jgi:hypothetical protein
VVRLEAADVAVVDHDADLDGLADLVDVRGDAFLVGLGEVMGQKQDALGAEALGFLCVLDGHARRATGAGEDRDESVAGIDRGLDDGGVFLGFEGKELTRAARGEERGGAVRSQPLQALGVARGVEIAVGLEVGDREGEQSGGEDLLEFEGGHGKKGGSG